MVRLTACVFLIPVLAMQDCGVQTDVIYRFRIIPELSDTFRLPASEHEGSFSLSLAQGISEHICFKPEERARVRRYVLRQDRRERATFYIRMDSGKTRDLEVVSSYFASSPEPDKRYEAKLQSWSETVARLATRQWQGVVQRTDTIKRLQSRHAEEDWCALSLSGDSSSG
jgi:hypothetical protein